MWISNSGLSWSVGRPCLGHSVEAYPCNECKTIMPVHGDVFGQDMKAVREALAGGAFPEIQGMDKIDQLGKTSTALTTDFVCRWCKGCPAKAPNQGDTLTVESVIERYVTKFAPAGAEAPAASVAPSRAPRGRTARGSHPYYPQPARERRDQDWGPEGAWNTRDQDWRTEVQDFSHHWQETGHEFWLRDSYRHELARFAETAPLDLVEDIIEQVRNSVRNCRHWY